MVKAEKPTPREQMAIGGGSGDASLTDGPAIDPRSERQRAVEEWRDARYDGVLTYPGGTVIDAQGKVLYVYDPGARLIILGQEVMDSCQRPWARETVNRAFDALRDNRRDAQLEKVEVLERGFGMGIVASQIMRNLRRSGGGNYTCIELNEQVADYADTEWRRRQLTAARSEATAELGGKHRDQIGIEITRGEAFEETARLAEEGREFDIIISDTYPLTKGERTVNDLMDLDRLVSCLKPDGVFAFFGYHEGYRGSLNVRQFGMLMRHFDKVDIDKVAVNPPPDYKYFNPPNDPVREIPVVICTKPKIYLA